MTERFSRVSMPAVGLLLAGLLAIAGCGGSGSSTPIVTATATPTPVATLSGTVQGGLGPVSSVMVTLYQAGTGYGENAISLGSATTDSNGKFTVGYTPPAEPAVLYLLALGENAGPGVNSAIGLIGVAGISNALPASVSINELTTVAAQWALAQFIDSTGQVIGAPSSNAVGFANAVNQAQVNLADITSGGPAGFWSEQGASEANCTGGSPVVNCDGLERLDTIANILAACIESSGPSSGACATLLANTGGGATTLQAAHAMATNPTANVAALYALQSESPPFAPVLSSAPDGFEIALNLAPDGANIDGPRGVAIDAAGDAWIANFGNSSVTELTASGALAGNFAPTGAGFIAPEGIAIDAEGNAWIADFFHDSVVELTAGGALAGNFNNTNTSGANLDHPLGVAIDKADNAWVTNESGDSVTELTSSGALVGNFKPAGANFQAPWDLAIDAAGNAWVTNEGGTSVSELTAGCSNSSCTGLSFAPSGSKFVEPNGLAIDIAGNVWVANYGSNSVTELTASGGLAGNFDNTNTSGANFNGPSDLAIDTSGNVWVTNNQGNSVTELLSGSARNFLPSGAGFNNPVNLAIDAAGDVWVTNGGGTSAAELIGAARPVLTPQVSCLRQSTPGNICLP